MVVSASARGGVSRRPRACACSTSYNSAGSKVRSPGLFLDRTEGRRANQNASATTVVGLGKRRGATPTQWRAAALKVSFQGVHGAYSEQAAKKCYPDATLVPCPDFETTHKQVADGLVDRAVIPVENSLGGSIHVNYDLLMKYRLHVIGEVYHKVRHCLLANPGVKLADIKRVQSHPQALAQCDGEYES